MGFYRNIIIFIFLQILLSNINFSSGQNLIDSTEAQKNNLAGMEYLTKKEYLHAYYSFQKAVFFNPTIKYYRNNLAVACMNLKKYEEALLHLNIAIEIDPLYVRALTNKAICHFHLSQYRLAFKYYQKARNTDGTYTNNRFTQKKIIRKMEQIQKMRPHDAELQQIIDRVRKLETMP